MLKISILDEDIELKLFAKGNGAYGRDIKLYIGESRGEQCMFFDTADEEYGLGKISLKHLKKVIDEILRNENKGLKVCGYLNKDFEVKNLITFPPTTPVYTCENAAYLRGGTFSVMLTKEQIEHYVDLI